LLSIYPGGACLGLFRPAGYPPNDSVIVGLTLPQLLSLAMAAAGGIWLARAHKAGGLELHAASAA
jgi:hypothetical protein